MQGGEARYQLEDISRCSTTGRICELLANSIMGEDIPYIPRFPGLRRFSIRNPISPNSRERQRLSGGLHTGMNMNSTSLVISIMFIFLYIVNESYNILYLSFFRYFKRELVPKGAIDVQALPKYFVAWIQKGSDQCIYTAQQLKRYKQPHLHARCWYLDCVCGFVFDSEAEVKTLHDGGVEVEEDTTQVTEDAERHHGQSSAPPPKPKRGRCLRRGTDIVSLGSESQASELGQTQSSVPGSQTLFASQSKVVLKTAPSSTTVPSSVSALEITRGLIE